MQNFNPYYQQRFSPLKIIPVSNILEANATPVDSLEPVFFYNRAENVIYKKQIDGTGAAPIQIFKTDSKPDIEILDEKQVNILDEKFKSVNDRLDGLYEIIKGGNNESDATITNDKNRK